MPSRSPILSGLLFPSPDWRVGGPRHWSPECPDSGSRFGRVVPFFDPRRVMRLPSRAAWRQSAPICVSPCSRFRASRRRRHHFCAGIGAAERHRPIMLGVVAGTAATTLVGCAATRLIGGSTRSRPLNGIQPGLPPGDLPVTCRIRNGRRDTGTPCLHEHRPASQEPLSGRQF